MIGRIPTLSRPGAEGSFSSCLSGLRKWRDVRGQVQPFSSCAPSSSPLSHERSYGQPLPQACPRVTSTSSVSPTQGSPIECGDILSTKLLTRCQCCANLRTSGSYREQNTRDTPHRGHGRNRDLDPGVGSHPLNGPPHGLLRWVH